MKALVDTSLGGSAVTSPIWIQHIADGFHIYVLVGGAILLTLRCLTALIDLKRRDK